MWLTLSVTLTLTFCPSWAGVGDVFWGVMPPITDDSWLCCCSVGLISPKETCRKLSFFTASFCVTGVCDEDGRVTAASLFACPFEDRSLCEEWFVTGLAVVVSDSSSLWVSNALRSLELLASSDLVCSCVLDSARNQ